jgi:hypothetical protein
LNGGPSKTPIVLSSQPVTIRNGLAGRKSQELIDFDCPDISPTDVPVSAINTCPNLEAQIMAHSMELITFAEHKIMIKICQLAMFQVEVFLVLFTPFRKKRTICPFDRRHG